MTSGLYWGEVKEKLAYIHIRLNSRRMQDRDLFRNNVRIQFFKIQLFKNLCMWDFSPAATKRPSTEKLILYVILL